MSTTRIHRGATCCRITALVCAVLPVLFSPIGKASDVSPEVADWLQTARVFLIDACFTDLQGLMHQEDTRIVAVCDVNRGSHGYKTATQFRGREPARKLVNDYYAKKQRSGTYCGCDAYNDFRELLARQDVDAVSITTPDHWHAIQTIMAAQAGKHIYCQKLLSLTIAEGRATVEAVRRHGVILQTGTQHRSKETMRFACELIRNGRIGKISGNHRDRPERNSPLQKHGPQAQFP